MDAIFKCHPLLKTSADDSGPELTQKGSAGTYTDEETVANKFLETLRTSADSQEKLRDELSNIISTNGLTENLAERILRGVEAMIQNELKTGEAMAKAIKEAKAAAEDFARKEPCYSDLIATGTIIAIGVLAMYAPIWVIEALGFTARDPRLGSFAARWMSAIAKQYGGVARGSIYAYFRRLGMTWKASRL